MKFTIPLLFIVSIVFLSSSTIVSDDLILKKTKSGDYEERFFVYKDQPAIKHNQYVKMFTNIMGVKEIVEMGNYEQNQKTGIWIEFNYQSSKNIIKSFGTYTQGIRDGEWSYFYKNVEELGLLSSLLNKKKAAVNHTSLLIPKSKNEICTLNIDTTNVRLMETGRYERGKKIGVWEYYSRDGNLLHKYDHTERELLENHELPENSPIYLGGFERFYNFTSFEIPIKAFKNLCDTNKLDFLVKRDNFELVAFQGDSIVIDAVMNMLNSAPNNWIRLNSDEKSNLHFLFQLLRDPVTLHIKRNMRFKYVGINEQEYEDLEPDLLISPSN